MIRGEQYRIKWTDDNLEITGIYRGSRNGFHLFTNLEDTIQYTCRLSSITAIRLYPEGDNYARLQNK